MNDYIDNLKKLKSLLIVTSLQNKPDKKAFRAIQQIKDELDWNKHNLMIDDEIWDYVVNTKKYEPKLVFCHPEVVKKKPFTSLYYRGLTGLSLKAAKDYFGAIENIEKGKKQVNVSYKKTLKICQVYNTFICSNIKGSTNWTLENGKRTVIATLGISFDGSIRNRVGDIAEEKIRGLIVDRIIDNNLLLEPSKKEVERLDDLPKRCVLKNNIVMEFSSEPDIAFSKMTASDEELMATIEIKGGTDPAGALERYGAATKSFQHALLQSKRCKNFFLAASFTDELRKRINEDRLVENSFNIIDILENEEFREDFFNELFHYTLRLV